MELKFFWFPYSLLQFVKRVVFFCIVSCSKQAVDYLLVVLIALLIIKFTVTIFSATVQRDSLKGCCKLVKRFILLMCINPSVDNIFVM